MDNSKLDTVAVPAIAAKGLGKWFGDEAARVKAVDDVTFSVRLGEMVYIVGPSGSGKTTLLSMLSGILRPDTGSVVINGQDIWALDADQLAELRLQQFGFVFQDYHLFSKLTCAENVAIPLILRYQPWNTALQERRESPKQGSLGIGTRSGAVVRWASTSSSAAQAGSCCRTAYCSPAS
ncbi:ATP-binding cassette domain-containing protein [Pseudomonas monteilii]|uniref:ABC transporter ATP-binding protein n=1 Tax=Pseudomonas monteilii TaxID=76759 RepID=UPI0015F8FC3A|nr:ATP-binding cassette domain-containing protein [Pseudomonas monteilii]MBA6090615.1 ATP-binding cassette domain-containing protein [Pseudomonas monteilii]